MRQATSVEVKVLGARLGQIVKGNKGDTFRPILHVACITIAQNVCSDHCCSALPGMSVILIKCPASL